MDGERLMMEMAQVSLVNWSCPIGSSLVNKIRSSKSMCRGSGVNRQAYQFSRVKNSPNVAGAHFQRGRATAWQYC